MVIRNKFLFYFLSFTWGLPLTLIGCVVAVVLLAIGHKPKKYGYCYYFEVGENWGGLELGAFFLTDKNSGEYIRAHELGHGLQNCVFGPTMMFIISIPSAIRYWYRIIKDKIGKPCNTGYYDIWFEKQASKLGTEFMDWYDSHIK